MRPRVAIVTLGDTRRSFFEKRANIACEENEKVRRALAGTYDLCMPEPVFSAQEAIDCADAIRARGIGCVVIHVPIWGTPALAADIARATDLPVLVLGNRRLDSSSIVCLLAAAGMLDQMGVRCTRLAGSLEDADTRHTFDAFVMACHAVQSLRRNVFCAIGGRSIGIGTTVADPSQWQARFGCGFDHCDQYEIVRRAAAIDAARVSKHRKWIEGTLRAIVFGDAFTEASLDLQIRSYLAIKDIVAENGYDFIGLKCQQEMSDHFVLQCLGVALLNNDCDADGPKKPTICACECDCDGALSMKMLSLLAGDRPACLVDIRYFDARMRTFTLANCGSVALSFASEDTADGGAVLMEHVFGDAGGGSVQLVMRAGVATLCRLFRSNGRYALASFEGDIYEVPRETLRETTFCYPHAFVRADIDYDRFFHTINANHLHIAYGRHNDALRALCGMLGIDYMCYNDKI